MMKSALEAAECDEQVPEPYWDEVLRSDHTAYVKFLNGLVRAGYVGFRRRIRSSVGVFRVPEKDGTLRMVIDARKTNSLFRAPPRTSLSPGAAMAAIWRAGGQCARH